MSFFSTYIEQARQKPFNDAAEFGVRVEPAQVQEGKKTYRLIGVHHLLPGENLGKQNVFITVLDKDGKKITSKLFAGWDWEGRLPNQKADPAVLDKNDANTPEINGDIVIWPGMKLMVFLLGPTPEATVVSDRVVGLTSLLGDEYTPDGIKGSYTAHHSYHLIFQEDGGSIPPQPIPDESYEQGYAVGYAQALQDAKAVVAACAAELDKLA